MVVYSAVPTPTKVEKNIYSGRFLSKACFQWEKYTGHILTLEGKKVKGGEREKKVGQSNRNNRIVDIEEKNRQV